MKWFNCEGTSSTLHKHLICFQDQSPFQKCLTQQELAKPLNSNNFTVYVWNNENKNSWDILLRNQVILNSKFYYVLIVDDVVQAAR